MAPDLYTPPLLEAALADAGYGTPAHAEGERIGEQISIKKPLGSAT